MNFPLSREEMHRVARDELFWRHGLLIVQEQPTRLREAQRVGE